MKLLQYDEFVVICDVSSKAESKKKEVKFEASQNVSTTWTKTTSLFVPLQMHVFQTIPESVQ